jgi:hypothetical protein
MEALHRHCEISLSGASIAQARLGRRTLAIQRLIESARSSDLPAASRTVACHLYEP